MSKINCPSCGKEINSQANFCEYCGKDINKSKSNIEIILDIILSFFRFNRKPKLFYKEFTNIKKNISKELEIFSNDHYIKDLKRKSFKEDNEKYYEMCCKLNEYSLNSKIDLSDDETKLITNFIDKYVNLDKEVNNHNIECIKKSHKEFDKNKAKYHKFIDDYDKKISYDKPIYENIKEEYKKEADLVKKLLFYEDKENYDFGSDKLIIHKFNDIYANFYEIKKDINNKIFLLNSYMDKKENITSFIDSYAIDDDCKFDDFVSDSVKDDFSGVYDLVCKLLVFRDVEGFISGDDLKIMDDFCSIYSDFDNIKDEINKMYTNQLYSKYEEDLTMYIDIINFRQDFYVSGRIINKLLLNYDEILKNVNILLPYCDKYGFSDYIVKLKDFPQKFDIVEKSIKKANDSYIKRELKDKKEYFDKVIPHKPLDNNQRKAVIIDEDNTQIIAGAGCGKTLTLQAKAKYLIENKNIQSSEILAISYSRKAVNDLSKKMRSIGLNIDTKTFHKLGIDILKDNNVPHKVFDRGLNYVIKKYFEEKLINKDQEFISQIVKYFAFYIYEPLDKNKIDKIGEVYDYERGFNLSTFAYKFNNVDENISTEKELYEKYEELKDSTLNKTTLKGEFVKSLEERIIANFLYINGINYTYEKEWKPKYDWQKSYDFLDNLIFYDLPIPKNIKNNFISRLLLRFLNIDKNIYWSDNKKVEYYRPDFYLEDYDIYLEHFGVNKEGDAPWLKEYSDKYKKQMENKRKLHKKYGTTLIETYSYYQSENRLCECLEKILKKCGVSFNPIDYNDLFNKLIKNERTINEYWDFIETVKNFINLFKEHNYNIDNFDEFKNINNKKCEGFRRERHSVLLDIIKDIYIYYYNFLKKGKLIDFNDMISVATDIINKKGFNGTYKYILVDEFQDISHTKFNFIKTIKNILNAKLVIVGDDWQSIYKFSGSDIDLFTNFNKYLSNSQTEVCSISNIYRNSQNLIDISSKFVMKNKYQLKKQLSSKSKNQIKDSIKIYQYSNKEIKPFAFERIINDIYDYSKKDKVNILVLGRNRNDYKEILHEKLFKTSGNVENKNLKIHYFKNPNIFINYNTVHGSKGIEEDNVILINLEDRIDGFPNKMTDDTVLMFVKYDNIEPIDYAEERRLFYVALTRTKEHTFLLAPKTYSSLFIDELKDECSVINIEKNLLSDDLSEELINEIFEDKIRIILSTEGVCPKCGTGKMNLMFNPKSGKKYFKCSNSPKCDGFGGRFYGDIKELDNLRYCPICGGLLLKKTGKYGEFYGCMNFNSQKKCKFTKNIDD